jgi:osmotically-inducible protein OsmY
MLDPIKWLKRSSWQRCSTPDEAVMILDSQEMPHAAPADEELQRRVINYLHLRQLLDIGKLRIEVQGGQVTIQGSLPSPQAKRVCLECCRRVAGVLQLKDELSLTPVR